MLSYRISPALYGNPAHALDGITSAEIRLGPERLRDGMIVIPSAARLGDGRPRFELTLPVSALHDVSTQLLVAYELMFQGFEAPYRLFLEAHLEPGDVFIDVGAHWGTYTLDVAARGTSGIAILACEPVPANLQMLHAMVRANGVAGQVEVIPMAVADFEGQAAMIGGNSMTWRLAAPHSIPDGTARFPVRVATVDAILRDRPALRARRTFLKIDVEGAEWAVLQGARAALDSGRVAAIIVEYHPGRGDAVEMGALIRELSRRGYRLARFPHHHMGGAVLDFAPDDTVCNLVAAAPELHLAPAYTAPYRGFAPLPPPYYHEFDAAQRARRDAILREWRATDGARWSDSRNAAAGAGERARLVAAGVAGGERVLDLGAGSGAQKAALPPRCTYLPVDLLQRDSATTVLDLNRTVPDPLRADHVIASHVLEHLHQPAALLSWCAAHAPRLTCVHSRDIPAAGDRAGTPAGEGLVTMLNECGWRVLESARHGEDLVYRCEAR